MAVDFVMEFSQHHINEELSEIGGYLKILKKEYILGAFKGMACELVLFQIIFVKPNLIKNKPNN